MRRYTLADALRDARKERESRPWWTRRALPTLPRPRPKGDQ